MPLLYFRKNVSLLQGLLEEGTEPNLITSNGIQQHLLPPTKKTLPPTETDKIEFTPPIHPPMRTPSLTKTQPDTPTTQTTTRPSSSVVPHRRFPVPSASIVRSMRPRRFERRDSHRDPASPPSRRRRRRRRRRNRRATSVSTASEAFELRSAFVDSTRL